MIHNPDLSRADGPADKRTRGPLAPGEAIDELIVRAHYLALDLRVAAMAADFVDPAITSLAADFLRYWAVETGRRLDRES